MVKNTRAIAPIISIILLLMVTIAIAGLAYTWLQKMQTNVQTSSENSSTKSMTGMQATLEIDGYNLNCNAATSQVSFYVRNSGTTTANNLQLYVDEVYIAGGSASSLATGSTTTLLTPATETCGSWENVSRNIVLAYDEGRVERAITPKCAVGTSC